MNLPMLTACAKAKAVAQATHRQDGRQASREKY